MHLVTLRQLGAEPDVVTWDSTGSAQPDARTPLNRGCPVGYFAQLVPPGTGNAAPYGNPNAWIRCRRIATSTADTIARESAQSFAESYAVFTEAAKKTLKEFSERAAGGFQWAPRLLLVGGLLIGGAYLLPLLQLLPRRRRTA